MLDQAARWYVLYAGPGREEEAKIALEETILLHGLEGTVFEVLVPLSMKGDTPRLLPGYVLVRMILTEETWSLIRSTRGISGYVGMGHAPTPFDEKEVEKIKYQMGLRKDLPATAEVKFSSERANQPTTIVDGKRVLN